MDEFPTDFLSLLLGVVIGAFVLALIIYGWRQYKLRRLQSPRKDYFYPRKKRR